MCIFFIAKVIAKVLGMVHETYRQQRIIINQKHGITNYQQQ